MPQPPFYNFKKLYQLYRQELNLHHLSVCYRNDRSISFTKHRPITPLYF